MEKDEKAITLQCEQEYSEELIVAGEDATGVSEEGANE
jgi:hypothetical protein